MGFSSIASLAGSAISSITSTGKTSAATEVARTNAKFNSDQFNEWKAMFGPIEQNMADYYRELTPERIASFGLQEQQAAHQQVELKIHENMAQRGIADSKFAAYAHNTADMENEHRKATIRATSDQEAAAQKMGFLQLGLNQKQGLIGNLNNANNGIAQGLSNEANAWNNNSSLLRGIYDDEEQKRGLNDGLAYGQGSGTNGVAVSGQPFDATNLYKG